MELSSDIKRVKYECDHFECISPNSSFKENYPPDSDFLSPSTNSNISQVLDQKVGSNNVIICTKATPKKCNQKDFGKSTPQKYNQNMEEPVTPNTNFKLLTSVAASQDYANCGTPKSKKEDHYNEKIDVPVSCDTNTKTCILIRTNRKEKSLALICSKFLDMYPLYPSPEDKIVVSLDDVSTKLGVERRRLYDIVNVFESIGILTRNAKNQYLWFGKNNLLKSLHILKAKALKEKILDKLQFVLNMECGPCCKQTRILDDVQNFNRNLESGNASSLEDDNAQSSHVPELRKEKSLGIMSQKFLMLFLVSPSKVISLGVAAKVLNGFNQRTVKGAQVKTQVRRLYDIANVFSSIGLIQKEMTLVQLGRKPAFKYIGPDLQDLEDISTISCLQNNTRAVSNRYGSNMKPRSLVRHSSFQEICAVAEMERRKLGLDETPLSAPPFESNLKNTDESSNITSFSLIKFDDLRTDNKDVVYKLPEIKIERNQEKGTRSILKPLKVKMKPQFKVVNLPKSTTQRSVPYYILNTSKSDKSANCANVPNVLVLKSPVHSPQTKQAAVDKKPVSNECLQTLEISSEQRDAILKSLNLTLSDGQIAAIQLEGRSIQPNSNKNSSCNVVKIIHKNVDSLNENEDCRKNSASMNDAVQTDTEQSGSLSICSTRTNSPSRMESPLSIPSSYPTPVPPNIPDITFPSNTDVDYFLQKIESYNESVHLENKSNELNYPTYKNEFEVKTKGPKENSSECLKTKEVKNIHPRISSVDSGSNDSLNAEVSNILKGKQLGDNASKNEVFLIDEKTLLSPIKKPQAILPNISSLVTSPYYFPGTVFVLNTTPVNSPNGSFSFTYPISTKTESPVNNEKKLSLIK
ncbi:transcription factor E2F7-like [Stegodyphus dumicola]|uniref:transcription factor E2F7-like n=1 Tax=Stegodyphus dumicola TaxID=202533 RepID=UPI0015ADAAB2|nr:transcription factor E2F7-like [Stegodyphus dumicola]XP_035212685.1 transcription factor E2F7-like [Stegodyphus dumicola]